jgi:SAM-dependent methyltransferase
LEPKKPPRFFNSMSHPSEPGFWNDRYLSGTMPWDFGGVPPRLQRYLAERPTGGRVLIPGCGNGHEISAFDAAGYQVTALDFAPAAVTRARANVSSRLAERVLLGDFFTHDLSDAPFDLIYERTFFCALSPDLRPAYVRRVAHLLKPGGELVGFFVLGEEDGGPPYQLHRKDEAKLFNDALVRINDEAVADAHPLFGEQERWREYRRHG